MSDRVICLYQLQLRRLSDQLIYLRNHAGTLCDCERVAYFIDKAVYELDAKIAGQLASVFAQSDDGDDGA